MSPCSPDPAADESCPGAAAFAPPGTTGATPRMICVNQEAAALLSICSPARISRCESSGGKAANFSGVRSMSACSSTRLVMSAPLRASENDELLHAAIDAAILRKPRGHDFVIDRRHRGAAVPRHMSVTGG